MSSEMTIDKVAPTDNMVGNNTSPTAGIKKMCRRIIAGGLYHSGMLRAVRRLALTHEARTMAGVRLPRLERTAASKFGILCYHRVGTEGVPLFSRLDPRTFEAQMGYIRKHYRVVSLAQLCHELQQAHPVPPTVAITFDDGYRDLYSRAFPVLQRYEIPATVYLIGRCMETGEAPWYDRIFVALDSAPGHTLDLELSEPRRFGLSSTAARAGAAWEIVCYLRSIPDVKRREWCAAFDHQMHLPENRLADRMLDWEQVHAMQRGGVFFGAHTMSHPAVSQLQPSAFEEELSLPKRFLESNLDASVEDFAYPFGKPEDCGSEAGKFLSRCGYRSAATTSEGINSTGVDAFQLHRMQIGDDPSLSQFAFHIARMFLEPSTGEQTHAAASEPGKTATLQANRSV